MDAQATMYSPLHDPARDGVTYVAPLDAALRLAHKSLEVTATANLHDYNAMLRAAVRLEMTLRQLVASVDEEVVR